MDRFSDKKNLIYVENFKDSEDVIIVEAKYKIENKRRSDWNDDSELLENLTLLNSLLSNSKISISHSCGGGGTCGTCRIIVNEGLEFLSDPEYPELEMIQDRKFKFNERLACQARIKDSTVKNKNIRVKIKIPKN